MVNCSWTMVKYFAKCIKSFAIGFESDSDLQTRRIGFATTLPRTYISHGCSWSVLSRVVRG